MIYLWTFLNNPFVIFWGFAIYKDLKIFKPFCFSERFENGAAKCPNNRKRRLHAPLGKQRQSHDSIQMVSFLKIFWYFANIYNQLYKNLLFIQSYK